MPRAKGSVSKKVQEMAEQVTQAAKDVQDAATVAEIETKKKVRSTVRKTKDEAEKTVRGATKRGKKLAEDIKEVSEAVSAEAKEQATVNEIEIGKTVAKTRRKVKEAVKDTAKKAEKVSRKANAAKLEIIVQSPMGGNITAEEIAAKIPTGCDSVFVRVDQNKLWWIKGEETGSVDIW